MAAKYFNLPSYILSRFSFLFTHFVAVYWLNYLLNDPFNIGGATLDARDILPAEKCSAYIPENIRWNAQLFALWLVTHSGLARQKYKKLVGLEDHPLERPLFAAVAPIVWFTNIHFWKPISNCERWDPLQTSLPFALLSGVVGTLCLFLILTFLWLMPDHVFGTAKYQYPPGKLPQSKISYGYPYGLVRHPAATGFLWIYALLPAHTPSHYLLGLFWIVYIFIATLVFEEGGLKSSNEFGPEYLAYRKQVNAFIPRPAAIASFLGLKVQGAPKAPKVVQKTK
jgi:protein-S-isoprenylcysteine O-methyltransferase Ste14